MTAFPPMRVVRREFPRPRVPDPALAVADAPANLNLGGCVRGRRIAITAGSRGIADIAAVLRAAAAYLQGLGAEPVIVAAMGSHGGGTSDGQRRVRAHLGVTEEVVGAPVSTQMESVRGAVIGGLAILDNAYGEIALIEAVSPVDLVDRELELFGKARRLLPRLPVDDLDVLVVDEMGKTYAGTGMDTNVIGRYRIPGLREPSAPRIERIVVLRLSRRSEGNAQGIGLADLTTQRLVDVIDRRVTYLNTITSTFLHRGFIPITLASDREAIATALDTLGLNDPRQARLARIANTAHLERLLVFQAVAEEIRGQLGVEVGPEVPWAFTPDGHLADLP